jgi:hypothetical protein
VTDLWLRVAAHSLASSWHAFAYKMVRSEAEKKMDRGDRKIVYAPDGVTKLGAVSKSAPKKTAQVGNEGALMEWVRTHYPKSIEADADITGPEDEVKAFLWSNGGRHLLTARDRIAPKLRAEILEASTRAKAPVGPGGEMDVPGVILAEQAPSTVRFLPDEDATDVIIELVRSGAVKLPTPFEDDAPAVDGE